MSYELHRPRSLDAALALLERHEDAHVMAGATALVLLMRQGLVRPARGVSLRDAGMSGIRREADGSLWIGATTTIRDAETSDVVRAHCAALAEAFGRVATVRVRCQATVGGNLAHADPAQDPPPMFIALGAEVEIARAGGARRRVAVEDFVVDQFATALEPGELLVGVRVPPPAPGTRAAYVKFLPKTEDDYATVSVAAAVRVANGRIAEARIALGSVGATAIRARVTEEALHGAAPEEIGEAVTLVRDEIDPIDDLRGSAAYKREMAAVWTERAVRSLVT